MAISKVLHRDRADEDVGDESEFMEAMESGDHRRALTIAMTLHGDRVYRYALAITGEHQMADEVRQLVFVEAFRDLASFNGRSPVLIWLLGIARHRALDTIKVQKRWYRRYKHDPPDEPEVDDRDPRRDIDRNRIARLISRCMNKLAPAALDALVLRYHQELPYTEVAALAGDPVGTVQQRVARALPLLRKCVDRLLNRGGVP